jgi:dTDP-glucose 4,6-dehydratase
MQRLKAILVVIVISAKTSLYECVGKGTENMKIMVTGGSGFIGTNFIKYWLDKYHEDVVVNVDKMTYAAVETNHEDTALAYPERYFFEKADICDYDTMLSIVKKYEIETIVNFAAESHNSYAIINPTVFYQTNLMGVQTLLELTRRGYVKRLHHISTCEVYGSLELDSNEKFYEDSPLFPNTPYNSAKACGDLAVRAYVKTYDVPVTLSNCANNYGPYQFVEKMIPLFVTNLILGKPLTLYKESQNRREWLHVKDHCRAIDDILHKGELGRTYNIGSGCEKSIEDIAGHILAYFNKGDADKVYIPDRPSHDKRYLLDSSRIRKELGWKPEVNFEDGLNETIEWYLKNEKWWRPLLERRVVDETKWK